MGEIVLVRHGQANSHADNEDDYDRLSDLGRRQAGWLGDWLRARDAPFDLILSGSMRRHRQTAEAMGVTPQIDPRLNEMDYFALGRALADTHGIPVPEAHGFADHVPLVMQAWHNAEIIGTESFADFETRITGALVDAAAEGRRALCVTSGGVIGMALRHVLGLDPTRLAHVLLPIRNASIHRFHVRGEQMILSGFNATPHLDHDERIHALTHY